LVIFTGEYLLRLWVAAEQAPHHHLGAAQARHALRRQRSRPHRPARRAAVLVRLPGAGRPARPDGAAGRAVPETRALLAGDALASRCALRGAAGARRLPGDPDRHHADRGDRHAPGRGNDPAGEVRHHSGRHVVGHRDARHHRVRRSGAGHGAWPPGRGRHDLRRPDHDRAAGRYRSPRRSTAATSSSPGAWWRGCRCSPG